MCPDRRPTPAEVRGAALGDTGLDVSRLGLGLAALGRPGYINIGHGSDLGGDTSVAAMRSRAHAVLDAAYEAGVRYLDAARSYGKAEEFLGAWLAGHPREARHVVVGSKWGYAYTAGWSAVAEVHEVKDHSLPTFERQVAETRQILGPHLRLYQIHSLTPDSPVLGDRGVLDALARLRDGGVRVGITLSGPGQAAVMEAAAAVSRGGERLFSCVQATWNLLETSAGSALSAAHDSGMGVIVKEALANGRLAGRPGGVAREGLPLREAASRHGAGPDAVALAAVMAQPWADVVLSGAATVAQLASNIEATRIDLDGDTLRDLARMAEEPAPYWAERAALAWN